MIEQLARATPIGGSGPRDYNLIAMTVHLSLMVNVVEVFPGLGRRRLALYIAHTPYTAPQQTWYTPDQRNRAKHGCFQG